MSQWQGEPVGLEGQALSWQDPKQLNVGPMLPANAPILAALNLPCIYAISHLSEMGEALFVERLKLALARGLRMIQVREKQLSAVDLIKFTQQVIALAAPYGAKVLINSDCDTAKSFNLAGLHLSAHHLMSMQKKPEGIICGASCHNAQELAQAQQLDLDYVLLSPVKQTLSHQDAKPLGWQEFSRLITDCRLPVYALGGMHPIALHEARLHGAHGIAMQRGAWD